MTFKKLSRLLQKFKILKKNSRIKAKKFIISLKKRTKKLPEQQISRQKKNFKANTANSSLKKKDKIDKDYASKLKKLEDEISQIIAEQAKLKGYDMVVAKGVVLYGTNDITDDVIKAIKSAK